MTNDEINKQLEQLFSKGANVLDEAHHNDAAMSKISKHAGHATTMLERMAAQFTAQFKNMQDHKYRVFGDAYLQHSLAGVNTGRYYDTGKHVISGDEAINMMRATKSGRWSATSASQQKAIDYVGFIAELKQYILAGYAISVVALKVLDFFNVGTNTITYRAASFIARRLHDIIFMLDGGNVNNRFWRAMATVQTYIKNTENDNQHVGYTSETDLRGMATTLARYPTFTVDNQDAIFNSINNSYGVYYA